MPPQDNAPQQGGFGQLVAQVAQGLATISAVMKKAKPEMAEAFGQIQGQFEQAISALQGGDEGQEMSPRQPEGAASPEAGAAEVQPM